MPNSVSIIEEYRLTGATSFSIGGAISNKLDDVEQLLSSLYDVARVSFGPISVVRLARGEQHYNVWEEQGEFAAAPDGMGPRYFAMDEAGIAAIAKEIARWWSAETNG